MKWESPVIVNQHVTVNMLLNLVQTAHHVAVIFFLKGGILILTIVIIIIKKATFVCWRITVTKLKQGNCRGICSWRN